MALNNIETSMKLMHLTLLLVILNFQMCSGVLLDISGSSKFAVLSKPFTFTCTATDAANIAGTISFYQLRYDYAIPFGTLYQNTTLCKVYSAPQMGTVSCGNRTSRLSTTKRYLAQFTLTDSNTTVWFCAFGNNLVFSNNFTLHVNSAAEPLITDPFTLPIVFTVAQLVIGALPTFL